MRVPLGQKSSFIVVAAVGFFVAGCGKSAPDALTLYSLDGEFEGRWMRKEVKEFDGEKFYEWPVLGTVEIKSAAQRGEIMASLEDGLAQGSKSHMAKCFIPRHGIRAVSNGKAMDYVICFECNQLQLHQNDDFKTVPVTRVPQKVINGYLRGAGVPLAPGTKDE